MNKLFMEKIKQQKKVPLGGPEVKIQGFTVGHTVNSCTKGLWLWKEIIRIPYDPSDEDSETFPCIVVDTEGLSATD